MPLIEVNKVVKRYGAMEILKGLDMNVEQHQVVAGVGIHFGVRRQLSAKLHPDE